MTEELMVGTIGWNHDDWIGSFYPDDLPDDWRFAYYSNEYRAVLVTANQFQSLDKMTIAEWAEDSDEAFRFVIGIPETLVSETDTLPLKNFLAELAPLGSRVCGFLLLLDIIDEGATSALARTADQLQQFGPVCLDLKIESEIPAALLTVIDELNIGICWRPDRDDAPRPGGALKLALSSESDPKIQRHIIELLEGWMQESAGLAGLFLDSPDQASQARIIAEMLGI